MIRVFIGYDPREEVALHVLAGSIMRRSSQPVAIAPIALSTLKQVFERPRDPKQSTDFSFSRFLTPYLAGFTGWAIYMDCDMVMLDDVANLWRLRDETYALMCVQHHHVPKEGAKFLRQAQIPYARKNWSSVMLMNCRACSALTPEYVATASGLDLHQFKWLDDREIGPLPGGWNHLVDYDPPRPIEEISLLHFTNGGPYFKNFATCGYADVWREEWRRTNFCADQNSRQATRVEPARDTVESPLLETVVACR
jgi:lipopolysaccharide biosynthesis glycosyltransferase